MPYLFNTDADRQAMLDAIGATDVAELFDTYPEHHGQGFLFA